MRKIYASLFSVLFGLGAAAQVSVTATAGTTAATPYTTLKGAFDAINAGTHGGTVTVTINGNTTETATATLNATATGGATYTQVQVNAASPLKTITSNIAGPTIHLNGADNVRFNGGGFLQITNTNAAGPVLSLTNEASNNRFVGLKLKGATAVFTGTAASPTITSGVVFFGTGTNGNNNNVLDDCDIDGGNQAICLVFSNGTATAAGSNFNNQLLNCSLHDFLNPAIAAANAVILRNSFLWTLRNNGIFFSAPVSTGNQFALRGIQTIPSFTDDFHVIVRNRFGGSAFDATGTMTITGSGSNAVGFTAFDIQTGGEGNVVDSNTVRNVTLNYGGTGGSFGNAGFFGFIGGYDGVSHFRNNTVSNINLNNTANSVFFQAFHVNARVTTATPVFPTFNVSKNTVSNISATAGGTGAVQMYGLRLETSSFDALTNATLSNPLFFADSNSISNLSALNTGNLTFIRGIGTTNTQGAGANAQLLPWVLIRGNTLTGFSTTSTLSNYNAPAIAGIMFSGSSAAINTFDTMRIQNNRISNLLASNTATSGAVVAGILVGTGKHEIARNHVWDLRNAATAGNTIATRPGIVGINVRASADGSDVFNNFVSIGGTATQARLFGFLNNFALTGPITVQYNTFYIGGTSTGSDSSAAIARSNESFGNPGVADDMTLRNNIAYNARTGGTGQHYAVVNTTTVADLTSAYNNLYAANANTVALWGATAQNIAAYRTAANDASSKSVTVSFVAPATPAAGPPRLRPHPCKSRHPFLR